MNQPINVYLSSTSIVIRNQSTMIGHFLINQPIKTYLSLTGIVIVNESTVIGHFIAGGKPTNQILLRGNFLVQVKHFLKNNN